MEENNLIEGVLLEYEKLIWHIIHQHVRDKKMPKDHAQDMYQEACIRLMSKMGEYDPTIAPKDAYVAAIVRTTCMRYIQHYFKHDSEELDEEKTSIVTNYEFNVRDMIERFPTTPRYRKIIYKTIEGYKQQEIAKELQLSQSTISRVLSDFKDYLLDNAKD